MAKILSTCLALALPAATAFGYDVKVLNLKPALEYAAHQDFQNLVIGAWPAHTQARAQELFDTEKLIERAILPVLLVVENRNTFPVRIAESEIYLVDAAGQKNPSIPFLDVLLRINSKKPLSTLSGPKDLQVRKVVKKDMLLDFENKAFGEKVIAPSDSDHGIVFFDMPAGRDLNGCQLYLPEVVDFASGEPLIFFEFELR